MSFLSDLAERWKSLFLRKRQEREMAEELRFHVDRETAERIRHGAAPEAARREALLAFGGVEQYKEAVRDARRTRPIEELGADLRFALRGLRRNPGFTATAILVLGAARHHDAVHRRARDALRGGGQRHRAGRDAGAGAQDRHAALRRPSRRRADDRCGGNAPAGGGAGRLLAAGPASRRISPIEAIGSD